MDTPSRFPPLDPSTYKWRPSNIGPNQWQRPALGGESLWIPRPKDYHDMFIGGSLALDFPVPSSVLTRAAKAAWRRLRFEVPELAVSAGYGQNGRACMQYELPQRDADLDHWVEQTCNFEFGSRCMNFEESLAIIRQKKKRHDSEQVSLFLNSELWDRNDLVKIVDFIFNADHQITDGIGIRIILARFLALLAQALSTPIAAQEELDWQQSVTNLTPPWIGVINEKQSFSGPSYEKLAAANENTLFQILPQNPGLPLLSTSQPPIQKTHFISLTKQRSIALLKAINNVIGPESKITHLGHAAMVLALLRATSSASLSRTLCSPCWLNGRRYLNPFPGHPNPTKSYIPICQSFAPVVFSDLDGLVLSPSASKGEIKERLAKACKVATVEYGKIRQRESMLPECVVLFERLGKNMYLRQQQELLSENDHIAIPSSSVPQPNFVSDVSQNSMASATPPSNQQNDSHVRTADPFFLSDGITEQYIDHEYFDNAGKMIFEVDKIRFAANAEKNLIVRMSSWRRCITISGEWKECDYDGAMIVRFLEDMEEIMLSLIE